MLKAIRLLLLSLSLISVAHGSDFDFAKIKQSVFNVAVLRKSGVFVNPRTQEFIPMMRATAFFVNTPTGTVGVTNNHVCRDLHKGIPSIILNEDGVVKSLSDLDIITDVYMEPGKDICIFKTKLPHPGLNLGKVDPKRYDHVTITGFDGEIQMMISEGYIYGTAVERYFNHFDKCAESKFAPFSPNWFICEDYTVIPIYTETKQLKSTARVSPGWSGSPVLNANSEVVAIVNAYDIPTEQDNKEESYLHSVSEIQHAIANAQFIPFNDKSILQEVEVTEEYEEIFGDLGVPAHFLQ
jgi:hypothetical protein